MNSTSPDGETSLGVPKLSRTRSGRPVRFNGTLFVIGLGTAALCAILGVVFLVDGTISLAIGMFGFAVGLVALFLGGRAYALGVARQDPEPERN